jgi:uncharacterized protein YndB with AHSA1/START domain
MRIAIIGILVLVALFVIVLAVGWSLPVRHQASRRAVYSAPPDAVYEAITNVSDFPKWRSKVKSVEVEPPVEGKRAFRERGSDGDILYVIDETTPPRRLVTRIADKALPFGGTWTYELTPEGTGTALRITEDGEVYNPLFRFMSRFVFGHSSTIDRYLTDLGKKFGSAAAITD